MKCVRRLGLVLLSLAVLALGSCEIIENLLGLGGSVTLDTHAQGEEVSGEITIGGRFQGNVDQVLVFLDATRTEEPAELTLSTGRWSYVIDTTSFADGTFGFRVSGLQGTEVLDSVDFELVIANTGGVSSVPYDPLFLREEDIVATNNGSGADTPDGTILLQVSLVNLPEEAEGLSVNITGQRILVADVAEPEGVRDISWIPDAEEFITTVSGGEASFTLSIDAAFDFVSYGWDPEDPQWSSEDDVVLTFVPTGAWSRLLYSYDNALVNEDIGSSIFVIDLDALAGESVSEGDEVALTFDYSLTEDAPPPQ